MNASNNVHLAGRLGKDPELKEVGERRIAHLNLAVRRVGKKQENGTWTRETNWVRCTAWDKTADQIRTLLAKGDFVIIQGELRSSEYQTKTGEKRTVLDVVINTFDKVSSSNKAKEAPADEPEAAVAPAPEPVTEAEEIPF